MKDKVKVIKEIVAEAIYKESDGINLAEVYLDAISLAISKALKEKGLI